MEVAYKNHHTRSIQEPRNLNSATQTTHDHHRQTQADRQTKTERQVKKQKHLYQEHIKQHTASVTHHSAALTDANTCNTQNSSNKDQADR